MVKKQTIFRLSLIILILILSIIVISSGELSADIGDITEKEENITKGEVTYTEIKDKELIGYETVYLTICENTTEYNFTQEKFDTWENCSTSIDKKAEGDPIYSYSEIKALEYDKTRYDFIEKGCFICPTIEYEVGEPRTGKLLLCLAYSDGHTPKNCWIESGASYKIKDLETGKIIDSHLDSGVEIES